jgi:hypothetical protein
MKFVLDYKIIYILVINEHITWMPHLKIIRNTTKDKKEAEIVRQTN